jgi:serine/threonine protein kinase
MLYLHQNKIIYRDIKPDNIGFDMNGTLKLFDFGLAKELRPHKMLENGTYNLTGRTGSRRYMAPEVAMNKAYNSTADVYSFGILLHELCSLDKPFDGYTEAQHMDLVVIGGKRPLISHHGSHRFWPDSVRKLMEHCWLDDLHERPSFVEVIQILQSLGEDVVGSVVY